MDMEIEVNYLKEWLSDTRDDLSPYYMSKLDFLKLYGKRCSTQRRPSGEDRCETATNNDECIGGRELYCQYDSDSCSEVIDSICNYYDENGNYTEERFTETQVNYLDSIYKMSGMKEFEKAIHMYSLGCSDCIQTNAFQIIYNKFNIGNEEGQNKKSCYIEIATLMQSDDIIMEEIHEHRGKIYNAFNQDYEEDDNQFVKMPELVMYVYELMRKIKNPESWYQRYPNMFTHNDVLDRKIYEIIKKVGTCVQSSNPRPREKTIPNNLETLSANDFILGPVENNVLYNVVIYTVNIVKNTVYYIGIAVVNIVQYLIENYNQIVIALMYIILVRECLGFILDMNNFIISDTMNTATETVSGFYSSFTQATGWAKNMIGIPATVAAAPATIAAAPVNMTYNDIKTIMTKLKQIMPYLNTLYSYVRNVLCLLMPIITSARLVQSNFGVYLGNYIAKARTTRSPIPPSFLNKIGNIAFMETIIYALKKNILQCDRTVRAIGQNRDLVYVTDQEGDFARWKEFITMQIKHGTTQPVFRDFMTNFMENPLGNIKSLFLIIASGFNILSGNEIETSDDNAIIAKQGLELIYALMQGPFALETGVMSLGTVATNAVPFQSSFGSVLSSGADFSQRFLELCTIDMLWVTAVISGIVVGYQTDPHTAAYNTRIQSGTKKRRRENDNNTGGKSKKQNKIRKSRQKKRIKRRRRTHKRK